MKLITNLLLISFTLVFTSLGAGPSTNGLVYLTWNYPSNDLAAADTSGYTINFIVKGANTPLQPFSVISNMPWTNYPISGFDGTNYQFKSQYTMNQAGNFFFSASASNGFWGETINSNTSSTPPVSIQFQLKIAPN